MLNLIKENIPEQLKSIDQWICWKSKYLTESKRYDKIPKNPKTGSNASVGNPDTWTSFDNAILGMNKYNFEGIGIVLTDELGLVGVDVDYCIDNGKLTSEALDICKEFQSYVEFSPSGTGLRIFVLGVLPKGRRKKGNVEMYSKGRFLTVTGHKIGKSDTVNSKQKEIEYIHFKYLADVEPVPEKITTKKYYSNSLDAEAIIEKIKNSKSSYKFEKLMSGDYSDYRDKEGKPDHSSADLALCSLLAYWTNGNRSLIDEIFRSSGLYRDKWNKKIGNSTYGEMTISRSI